MNREDVRERNEEQGAGVRIDDLGDRGLSVASEFHEVRVGDDAAFGLSGSSGGVDQRRDVGTLGEVATPLDLLILDVFARRDELLQVANIELPDVGHGRDISVDLVEPREVIGGLGDDGDRAGVSEIPEDLAGCGRLVDRDHHSTAEPEGEVDERPLVGRLAHQSDPVSGLDARGDETLREGDYLGQELGAGEVAPSAIGGGQREQSAIGGGLHASDQEIGHIGVRIGLNKGGNVKLFHGNSFGTGRGHSP